MGVKVKVTLLDGEDLIVCFFKKNQAFLSLRMMSFKYLFEKL